MAAARKEILVVNLLFWGVAAVLHPVANLLPSASGQPPKIFEVLIPMAFVFLALGSTGMIARALEQQKEH